MLPKLSQTVERKLLKALESVECNPLRFDEVIASIPQLRMTTEQLKKYVQHLAAEAHHSKNSGFNTDLQRAIELQLRLQDAGANEQNDTYDLAIALQTIVNTEMHPEPDKLSGIDLKKIYSALAQMAMGNPVSDLDSYSKQFLKQCYEDVQLSINHNLWSKNVADLEQHFGADPPNPAVATTAKPTNPELSAEMAAALQHKELNPFGVPLDFLHLK